MPVPPEPADRHLSLHWDAAALATVDMQRGFPSEAPFGVARTTEVVSLPRRIVAGFRTGGRPIVHIVRLYQHGGLDGDACRWTLLAAGVGIVAPGSSGSPFRLALATDAVSLCSAQGFAERAGIGVQLVTSAQIVGELSAAGSSTTGPEGRARAARI